jgi:hypothetical protein
MNNPFINLQDMRVREFLIRTCLFLPMVIFGVLFVLMLFGIGADIAGAKSMFYCTVYCKICVGLLALAGLVVVIIQARACCKEKNEA